MRGCSRLHRLRFSPPPVRNSQLASYYDMKNPYGSVKTPKTGTKIRIDAVSSSGRYLQITVGTAKSPAK